MSSEITFNTTSISNADLCNNPDFRNKIFKAFLPTLNFSKHETSFPMSVDEYVKEVIMRKYEIYKNLTRNKTPLEEKEYEIIERHFLDENKNFNPHYYLSFYPDADDFKAEINGVQIGKSIVVLDEEAYGYNVGTQLLGVRGQDPTTEKYKDTLSPVSAYIKPTEEGFIVKYEWFYGLSEAINGLGWLNKVLPSYVRKKLDNLAFHYGDYEGVGIFLKRDGNKITFDKMLTYAHGSKGMQIKEAAECNFDNAETTHVNVFVSSQTHASYPQKFNCRNKFFDITGNKSSIKDAKIIDLHLLKDSDNPESPAIKTFPKVAGGNNMYFEFFNDSFNPKTIEDRISYHSLNCCISGGNRLPNDNGDGHSMQFDDLQIFGNSYEATEIVGSNGSVEEHEATEIVGGNVDVGIETTV